mgnify:CR=1 FL=1
MKFHENLLRLRAEQKLTQQQVAEGAGLSLRGYQNYERAFGSPAFRPWWPWRISTASAWTR